MPDDHGMNDEEPLQPDQWTDQGRGSLRAAADELALGVREHADTLAGLTGVKDIASVFAANHRLLEVAHAYAEAQLELTGTSYPFGVLPPLEDEEADDDEVVEEYVSGTGVSVVQRRDFVVTDEAAVLAAGRAAYDRVWSPDDPEEAASQVTNLALALSEIAHSDGWDALEHVQGLDTRAAMASVISHDDLLSADPDEWPDNPYVITGQEEWRR